MISVILLFVILSCSQPGIIIGFSHHVMQEVIENAVKCSLKYYGEFAKNKTEFYSKLWTRLNISHFVGYLSSPSNCDGVAIKLQSPTSLNTQIPLAILTSEEVEISQFLFFKTHPTTHMELPYPGVFINVDLVFGVSNGIPIISLANSTPQYYIQPTNNFTFYKQTKYIEIPFMETLFGLGYKAFKDLLKNQLTPTRIANAFNKGLPIYTNVSTQIKVSPKIVGNYSNVNPYYYDNGFWVSEINGTLYTPGTPVSQFSTNLPHFNSAKNHSVQIFVSQQILQQGANLMELKVNISKVNIGTFINNVNCTASSPRIIVGGKFIKMNYNGECDVLTSKYALNIKFNGVYNFTPQVGESPLLFFKLNSTGAQYNNQVVNLISGSIATFNADKTKIFSLMEEQVANRLYSEVSLPLPNVRCINDLLNGETNIKSGHVEVLFNMDPHNVCYLS